MLSSEDRAGCIAAVKMGGRFCGCAPYAVHLYDLAFAGDDDKFVLNADGEGVSVFVLEADSPLRQDWPEELGRLAAGTELWCRFDGAGRWQCRVYRPEGVDRRATAVSPPVRAERRSGRSAGQGGVQP